VPVKPEMRSYLNHVRKTRNHYNSVSMTNSSDMPLPEIPYVAKNNFENPQGDKFRNWTNPYKTNDYTQPTDRKTRQKQIKELQRFIIPRKVLTSATTPMFQKNLPETQPPANRNTQSAAKCVRKSSSNMRSMERPENVYGNIAVVERVPSRL
jgi:hypothetical protein